MLLRKIFKNTIVFSVILILGIAIGVTVKYVSAWVEPSEMPPGGNIAAPLNTGNVGQSKMGGLTLNINGATYGLLVANGLVGIGTTSPQGILDVSSTTSGFLPPRMTDIQRNMIGSPQAGMVIFNTSTGEINVYSNSGGTFKWEEIKNGEVGNNSNSNINFNGNFNGNMNVSGDIRANNYYVNNTNNSLGQNGLCLGGICKSTWTDYNPCPSGYYLDYTYSNNLLYGNIAAPYCRQSGYTSNVIAGCVTYDECFSVPVEGGGQECTTKTAQYGDYIYNHMWGNGIYHEARYVNGVKYTRVAASVDNFDTGYVAGTTASISTYTYTYKTTWIEWGQGDPIVYGQFWAPYANSWVGTCSSAKWTNY